MCKIKTNLKMIETPDYFLGIKKHLINIGSVWCVKKLMIRHDNFGRTEIFVSY